VIKRIEKAETHAQAVATVRARLPAWIEVHKCDPEHRARPYSEPNEATAQTATLREDGGDEVPPAMRWPTSPGETTAPSSDGGTVFTLACG
jgi:hypothetical protein